MRRITLFALVLVLSGAMALTTSCRKEPRGRCGRLIEELTSPARAKEAIRQLGEKQGGKTCAKAIPQLTKMFVEGRYREDILRSVKHMGKKEATQFADYKELLKQALKVEGSEAIAASIIEDWRLSEMKDDLVAMLSGKSNPQARLAALRALLSFAKPQEVEDVLIALTVGDPDKQGMRVNVMAVEALAEMGSTKGLSNIIKTLFLKTQQGEEMYQAARQAIAKIGGQPAADILVQTIKGENEDLRAFAKEHGLQEWDWIDGPKVVQVIGDLVDPSVQTAVAGNLAKKLVEPAGITEQLADAWRIAQSNRITINMLTLARIADDTIIPVLEPVITNTDGDVKQRLDSASVIAAIGSQTAIETLIKIYKDSDDQRFKDPFMRPLTQALDSAHLGDFDDLMKADQKKKHDLPARRLEADPLVMGALAVVRECEGDNTACLIKNLSAEPELGEDGKPLPGAQGIAQGKQWKAIMMLARKKDESDAVIPELVKFFEKTDGRATDLRNYALIALERLGRMNPKVYSGLRKVLKKEKKKAGYGFWNIELETRLAAFAARSK